MSRHRNFCFTLNNYEETDLENVQNLGDNLCSYLIYGKEKGDSGTPHLQGYFRLKNPKTFNATRSIVPRWHLEIAKGNADSNITYCQKEGNFVEIGSSPKGQGHRTDLDAIRDELVNQTPLSEIAISFTKQYIRYHRGIHAAHNMINLNVNRDWEMDVRIYWGKPGTGKTRAVYDEFGAENVYPKPLGKWWCGYNGQECVIIDDFDPNNCYDITFDFYLKLLDRYPLLVEPKGGSCKFMSKTIIFTSNYDPELWFLEKKNRAAFFRRVKEIRPFEDSTEDTEVVGNTSTTTSSLIGNPRVDKFGRITGDSYLP